MEQLFIHGFRSINLNFVQLVAVREGDRGRTVAKVLCYKSEGRWYDPSWCQWIFH